MTSEKAINTVAMLHILLENDYEVLYSLEGEELKEREKEIATCESCVLALKDDIEFAECDVINIDGNGIVHVYGYYECNENEYGPHPLRYVDIVGAELPYEELAERAKKDGTLAEFDAEHTQYPQDENVNDTDMIRNYAYHCHHWKAVSIEEFARGKLPAGDYRVM